MKKIYLFLFLAISLWTACEDDDDTPITLSLEKPAYTLEAETPLEIILNASENVKGLTAVSFRLMGTAVEDEDYTVSDKEFVFLPATQSARIRITPKENYVKDRNIILKLDAVGGFELTQNSSATISVEARKSVICNFTRTKTDLYDTRTIKLKVTDEEGHPWNSEADLHIPFFTTGTAEEGIHYTLEKDIREFIVPAGKDEAELTLTYQSAEKNRDELVFHITENNGIHSGINAELSVQIVQPNLFSDMRGTWAYDNQFLSLELFSWWVDDPDDLTGLPGDETSAGSIRFISAENDSMAVNLTGDLTNYFRSTNISFLKEADESLMEQDWLDAKVTYMTLGKANTHFSSAHTKERPVMVGFRFSDDTRNTLEIRIVDYEPTDFLTTSYQSMLSSLQGDDLLYPMKDFYPLVFNFKRQ